MYGVDYAYAATRLDGTYVRLMTGEPILINEVSGNGRVNYMKFRDFPANAETHLDEIDTCPMPLGYYNYEGSAYYVSRRPTRKYRQGLSAANISIVRYDGEGMNFQRILNYAKFADMVENVYPSFKEALQSFDNKVINPFSQKINIMRAIAWSRYWAMDKDKYVYYRNRKVGVVNGNSVSLGSRYQHLKEALEEVL